MNRERRAAALSPPIILVILGLLMGGVVMASGSAAAWPWNHPTQTYHVRLYDASGRYLNENNANLQKYMKVVIQKKGIIFAHTIYVGTKSGINNFTFKTDASRIILKVYWIKRDKPVFESEYPLISEWLNITLPFTPAVPITSYQAESVALSADMHEIQTKFYNVQFGAGGDKNVIQISVGGQEYNMPVVLHMASGSNSDTKDFRFLAQSAGKDGMITGTDKFLIWETGKYWSAVDSVKVGDNEIMLIWTYGYADELGAWVKTIIAAAAAGAAAGAYSGIGAGIGAGVAGLGASVVWAVAPQLSLVPAHVAMGVVVGLFTPRYFQIQAAGNLGANTTDGYAEIQNIPSSGRQTWNGISYEIYSESNTIQVGFTRDWGTAHGMSYDFETLDDVEAWQGDGMTMKDAYKHSGQCSGFVAGGKTAYIQLFKVTKGETYTLDMKYWSFTVDSGQVVWNTGFRFRNETGAITDIVHSENRNSNGKWAYYEVEGHFTAQENGTIEVYAEGYYSNNYGSYYDDMQISWFNSGAYRYIFDTQQNGGGAVIKYEWGTIPVISPASQGGIPIQNRYTLIAIDMVKQKGALAVDWASPLKVISPTRVAFKTQTYTEQFYLLGTDDKDGFKGMNFTIVNPKWFIYAVDWQTYYYFTTPDNWTITPHYSTFMANNTTWYIPNWATHTDVWAITQYNIAAWWESLGTLGHMAIFGLTLLIIFVILAVLAPQIIIFIFKIIGAIIRGIIKGVSALGKAIGKGLRGGGGKRR